MFRRYFSDFYRWNCIAAILFAASWVLVLTREGPRSRHWLIPACFILLLLTSARYYVLFLTALKDRIEGRVAEKTVRVRRIVRDDAYTFFNRGGALAGSEKLLLIASDGSAYRMAHRRDAIVETRPPGYYQDAEIVVRYLSCSRIVLHMRLSTAPNGTSERLLRDFRAYFA